MSDRGAPDIMVRDFREQDREAILAFSRQTWSWGDYIPDALDGWLREPDGSVRVAETPDGRTIGVQHYEELPGGQSWLSGLRVHPDFRGQGVAGAFLDDGVETAQRHGMHALRFASEVNNEPIQTLSRKRGLRSRGTWLSFERILDEAACTIGRGKPPLQASTSSLSAAESARMMSVLHASGHALFPHEWAWKELNLEALERLRTTDGVLVSRSGMGGWGMVLITVQRPDRLEASLLGADVSCALALLHVVQRRACEGEPGISVLVHTPQADAAAVLLATLARRGDWHPKMEHPLRIWEVSLEEKPR